LAGGREGRGERWGGLEVGWRGGVREGEGKRHRTMTGGVIEGGRERKRGGRARGWNGWGRVGVG